MNYNKDYATKTAEDWFSLEKWTGFLIRAPFGTTIWPMDDYRKILTIRATASMMSKDGDCDRKFEVEIPKNETRTFVLKVSKKKKEDYK